MNTCCFRRCNDAIPHELNRSKISFTYGGVVRIFDEVIAGGDGDAGHVVFLCMVVDVNTGVGDSLILGDICNLINGEEFNHVCAFDVDFVAIFVTLCDIA